MCVYIYVYVRVKCLLRKMNYVFFLDDKKLAQLSHVSLVNIKSIFFFVSFPRLFQ